MNQSRPEELERVPCPRCGGQTFHTVTSTAPNEAAVGNSRFSVVSCDGCRLTYANPRLSAAALSAAYASIEVPLDAQGGQTEAPPASGPRGIWRHLTQRQVVGDWVEQGPVLDVGCNVGDLLVALRARGFAVAGIESSPSAVARCRARGLETTQGTVEDVTLAEASYGTITMSHVLEHVADPVSVLRKLKRALVPGGRIVVAVPNRAGLVARLFGPHWHGWDPPFHLVHFDASSLRGVLEAAGFQVDRVLTRGNPDDVTRSLRKMLGRRVDAFWLRAALLPATLALGPLEQGGELCAVAHRPPREN